MPAARFSRACSRPWPVGHHAPTTAASSEVKTRSSERKRRPRSWMGSSPSLHRRLPFSVRRLLLSSHVAIHPGAGAGSGLDRGEIMRLFFVARAAALDWAAVIASAAVSATFRSGKARNRAGGARGRPPNRHHVCQCRRCIQNLTMHAVQR